MKLKVKNETKTNTLEKEQILRLAADSRQPARFILTMNGLRCADSSQLARLMCHVDLLRMNGDHLLIWESIANHGMARK